MAAAIDIPFVGQSYTLSSRNIDCQRTVNLYPLMDQTGKSVASLVHTPGLLLEGTFPDVVRGMLTTASGRTFVVHGGAIAEYMANGTFIDLGSLNSSEGSVSLAENGVQVCVVDGPDGYILRMSDNQFSQIVSDGWLGSNVVLFLDGYFIFIKPESQIFYISNPYDGNTFDPLNFASAEGLPDWLVGAAVSHKQLWLFGTQTIEVWYNSGGELFPFALVQGAFIKNGLLAAQSVTAMDDTLYFLGSNENGSGIVFRANGYAAEPVSTEAVETAIQGYATLSDAVGFAYQQNGHNFYVLNFPTANTSWVFDSSTAQWHERQYLNPSSGVSERGRPQFHTINFGKHLVSDYANGKMYSISLTTYTDAGDPIQRLRVSPHLADPSLNFVSYSEFKLDIQAGFGTLTGNSIQPKLSMRYSNDGGYNWSDRLTIDTGKIGEYTHRAIWRRLGMARDRVWEVTSTDEIPQTWMSAKVMLSQGRS